MSNILNSKKKMEKVIMEITQRLARCVQVLEMVQKAPHPSTWSDEDRQALKIQVDSAIEQARAELKV